MLYYHIYQLPKRFSIPPTCYFQHQYHDKKTAFVVVTQCHQEHEEYDTYQHQSTFKTQPRTKLVRNTRISPRKIHHIHPHPTTLLQYNLPCDPPTYQDNSCTSASTCSRFLKTYQPRRTALSPTK